MMSRIAFALTALATALPLASCGSMGAYIGDNLPAWAGGLPPGTPPRAGTPGYDDYLKSVNGNEETTGARAAPTAGAPKSPVRQPREPIDDPIH